MKIRMITVTALLLLTTVTGLAQAQMSSGFDRTGMWEFSVQTRYSWAQTVNGDRGTVLDIEDDLGWGFGFGYNVNEAFNLGFAFSWHSANYNATYILDDGSATPAYYSNELDTSTFALTGDYQFGKGRIKPYVSGNLGWTMLDTNIYAGTSGGCWWDPWWGYVCSTYSSTFGTDEFTYGLGAGLRFELTPKVFLRGGYEHNWVDLDNYSGNDILRVDIGTVF